MQAKTRSLILSISLVLSLFIGACGAISSAAPAGTLGAAETIEGMRMVVANEAGTFLMQKGEVFLMAWPRGTNYAMTVLSQSGASDALNGMRVNAVSLTETVKALEADGWKYITPAALPKAITEALAAYSVEMAVTALKGLPTVFIMPIFMVTPDFLQPEVVIQ
ncbi:hypothetical protein ADN00_18795 [Ornatilinea apprima]|uniref:Uncharacterized protein n=1 Tax=Ornatilinea apprima TaxID=1134406 RepID=A0A0P6WTG6_9CHLR|nr:hypothetical protein [Ornatilinea apprima]KPL70093.1 hypothetical protein ADN00_18795 [Ornatilinea apprima]